MIRKVFMSTLNNNYPQLGMQHAFRSLFGDKNVTYFDFEGMKRANTPRPEINRRFVEAAILFKPDWMWLQFQGRGIITPESILEIRKNLPHTVISHWMGDCRRKVGPKLAGICRVTHLTLITNNGQFGMYRKAGAPRVEYCQHAIEWNENVLLSWPPKINYRVPDVVFCGNFCGQAFPGTKTRLAVLDGLLKAGIDFGVIGSKWPDWVPVLGTCHAKQQIHIYHRTKVCISINHFHNVPGYYSGRLLYAMVSGKPVISEYIPGLELHFQNRKHLIWFGEIPEFIPIVKELLGNEDLRNRIGRAGRAIALRNHTWFSRLFNLMPVIEEIQRELA